MPFFTRTSALLLPLLIALGCHSRIRPDVQDAEAQVHLSDIPASTDTAKAVSLITRVHSFNADGLDVTTIARSLQGGNKRIETLSELEENSSIQIEIHRHDLQTIFRLDPKTKTFTERPIPKALKKVVPAKSAAKSTKRSECQSRTDINGPGPLVQVNNRTVQLYKVNTKMVCRDKRTKKELRRYNYREYVWASSKRLNIDSAVNISTETFFSYDMLTPMRTADDFADRADIAAESANLVKRHIKTVLSIPGTPVRRDQVSTTILNGKEVPFTPSEKSNYLSWHTGMAPTGSSGEEVPVGSTATVKNSISDIGKPRVPEWVLSVDPAFLKHGGVARRVDYLDIQVRNPKGLFDVPGQYEKAPSPK